MHQLSQHQKKKKLVSVFRCEIDDNAIQGFVLASSEELIVIQCICDFRLDGLMVLRTKDVTEVRCSATDEFQNHLLAREGLLEKVPFGALFDLTNWRSVIAQLSMEYPIMVLECEAGRNKDFVIGRVIKDGSKGVQFQHFSGVAIWAERYAKLKYKDITCCQVGTNYVNVYQRHFERSAL
ncbi:MAG: hypothetical protein IPL70_10985 [Uliginosibacterium sp.]|nr:hypothetical protein [Uliginosibacterium sp.]